MSDLSQWNIERIEDEIQKIIDQALNAVRFEVADNSTLANFRSMISKDIWQLKDNQIITGYTIHADLVDGKIYGNVTYTPRRIAGLKINFHMDPAKKVDSFKRAMKGV